MQSLARNRFKTVSSFFNFYHAGDQQIFSCARIFNALASLKCSLADFVRVSGLDVLTIGGTKSGLMFGEAVIMMNKINHQNRLYHHKRSMQLASKNRFIAAQFTELLSKDLWKEIALPTNALAKYFSDELKKIEGVQTAYPVETNMVFLQMKPALFRKLKNAASFYMWDEVRNEVRFAFSFSNAKGEIDHFIRQFRRNLGGFK